MNFPLVYLTGIPASGKTTLVDSVKSALPAVEVLEYSILIADHLAAKHGRKITHEELRRSSASLITPEDVAAVDEYLIAHTIALRRERPVIVASHPVTREKYGYRVLPFSPEMLRRIAPTAVCMLVCSPETVNARVEQRADGRPNVSVDQTAMHATIQSAIATIYGFNLAVPMYFLESDAGPEAPTEVLLSLLSKP